MFLALQSEIQSGPTKANALFTIIINHYHQRIIINMTIVNIKNIIIKINIKMIILMASASTKLKFKVVRANTRFNCCEGWK